MNLVEKFYTIFSDEFHDPNWMREFLNDVVRKKQFMITVDENECLTAILTVWQFGSKRWGYIRKVQFSDTCPKQMGKGNHLYVPLFWIRQDRRGTISIKKFVDSLKREFPGATTLSWHDENGKFTTWNLIRRPGNVDIPEEGCSANAKCG